MNFKDKIPVYTFKVNQIFKDSYYPYTIFISKVFNDLTMMSCR